MPDAPKPLHPSDCDLSTINGQQCLLPTADIEQLIGADHAVAEAPQPVQPSDCDLITINRQQYLLRTIDIEQLIGADHPARLFWEVTGQLDLSALYTDIKTKRGCAGRRALDPRLMVAMWLYAYKRGIGSAREIAPDVPLRSGHAVANGNGRSESSFLVGLPCGP